MYTLDNNQLAARIDPDDPDLDISSLTLGYVNISQTDYLTAVYLRREARRQYKQGVDLNHLTQFVLRDKVNNIHPQFLKSKALLDSLEGNFPTFERAKQLIGKGWYSVALSRDVAIKREVDMIKVYVKTDEVGYMKAGSSKVNVPTTATSFIDMYFLREINGWDVVEGTK